MPESARVLALDLGSSSVRAALVGAEGSGIEAVARRPVQLRHHADGTVTLDPDRYAALVAECLDELAAAGHLEGVEAVATACQWHSVLAVSPDREPLTEAYTWACADRLTPPALPPPVAEELRQRTGCPIHRLYWTSRIPWLIDQGVEARARFVSLADHVLHRLAGIDAESPSIASGTGLLDLRSGGWDEEALALAGIDRTRVDPVRPTETTPPGGSVPRRWPGLASARWLAAMGDGAAASLGSGGPDPRRLAITVGTSAAVRRHEPLATAGPVPPGCWRYLADEDLAVTGIAWSGGGNLVAWARRNLVLPSDGPDLEAALETSGREVDAPLAIPYLYGARPGNPPALDQARILGLSGRHGGSDLLVALLDGLAFELRLGVEALAPEGGADELVAGGGAVHASAWWRRRLATVLRQPLLVLREPETSLLGVAAHARGSRSHPPGDRVGPDPSAVESLERRFGRYLEHREEAVDG